MPKRKAKKDNKKQIIFRVALLCFAVYMIYDMISLQASLAENRKILKEKQAYIAEKQISNEELENLLESGSDIDLIERAARDKLDYVYENEEIYEDSSGK